MKKKYNILLVDDEENILYTLKRVIESEGFQVTAEQSASKALSLAGQKIFDCIISDLSMPEMNGLDFLAKIQEQNTEIPVIIMTAYGDEQVAVRAIKLGAYHYIAKPFSNDDLITYIKNAAEQFRIKQEYLSLKSRISGMEFSELLGISPAINEVKKTLSKIADSTVSALITGESGTGKEVVARLIHQNSRYSGGPFVSLNCAAIPSELLESELFGHEKGSFTGANATKKGKFEMADQGTLFLDEIGDMSLYLQAKLLRVLPELKIERVGSTSSIQVNCRLIYATNKNLSEEIKNSRFREDLYYRINVVNIHLPPLRERREDIIILAEHFLKKFSEHYDKDFLKLPEKVKNILYNYDWPGNVRQLEHIIEQAVVLESAQELSPRLFEKIQSEPAIRELDFSSYCSMTYKEAKTLVMSKFDHQIFAEALKRSNGNLSQAARSLGLHYKNFFTKLKEIGLYKDTK